MCSRPSFRRKQESRPPAPAARWMPDHVRHDGSPPHGESLVWNALARVRALLRQPVTRLSNIGKTHPGNGQGD